MSAGTTLTAEELAELGAYVLNASSAACQMGHVSPAQSLVYMERPGTRMGDLYHDILRGHLHSPSKDVTEARERVERFLWESGWNHRVAEQVAHSP